MDKTQTIKASAQTLGLTHTKISLDEILHTAQENDYSYLDLIGYVFDCESISITDLRFVSMLHRTLQRAIRMRMVIPSPIRMIIRSSLSRI